MKHMWSEEELQTLIEEQGGGGGSGTITLDDIVDSQGNKRFIEGNGVPYSVAGITPKYYKWTLSGTHLMIVFAFETLPNATIDNKNLAKFEVPAFILNKINVDNGSILYKINAICFKDAADDVTFKCAIVKRSKKLDVYFNDSLTFDSYARTCRVQFDLIIESE